MPISFSQIPADLKVPLYWVEVDPSMAGLPVLGLPALLVGTMIATEGDATHDVPIAVGSQAQADAHFGQGSELSRCFRAYFANNFANQVYGLPVAEPTAGTASTATIAITTPPTDAGVISLYIGGELVAVPIAPSDTATDIAAAIAGAINALDDLPVTAVATTGSVALTCRWKGASGNDISVMLNYYGPIGGERTPPGLVMTMPVTGMMTGGVGVPTFTNAISNLGDQNYEYVSLPYSDSASLLAWETEYGFSDTGRWGWMRQQYGHIFSAKRDTYANLVTWGQTRNSGVTSVMGVEPLSPSPIYEWSAAYVAKAQRALVNDPARPLQTLTLNQIKLAPLNVQGARFDTLERQGLANSGIATQQPGSDNQPMIARETTTYQLNLYGTPDTAYELVTTLATLARLIRNQKQAITSKFPRCKLADDGTRFGPGQAIVTPSVVKAEIIAEYALDQYNGLTENTQAFIDNLQVERDTSDPNRLNVLYPPDLINQLRVFAVLAQFRLQYNALIDPTIGANVGQNGIIVPGMIAA
jgi:phage tail sheath gpL-like